MGILGQRQHDVRALDAAEFIENRPRAVAQPREVLSKGVDRLPGGRARVTRQGPADAPCPHPSDSRPTCPDLLIRALAEGSLAVIHGNTSQANAAPEP